MRSPLVSGLYVSAGAELLSTPTIAGTGGCAGGLPVCAQTGNPTLSAARSTGLIRPVRIVSRCFISRYDDGVPRLQLHVLGDIHTLDDFLVVEGYTGLGSVCVLVQNVD